MNETPVQDRSQSHIEITGAGARHYDVMMNLMSAGTYPFFIRRAVRDMEIRRGDEVLDLGAGTGRNARLMSPFVGEEGRIVGLDIGEEMLSQARRRCRSRPNVTFEKRRIEQPLPYCEEFNRVFVSFVLHGFVQEDRLRIIGNAHRSLRPGGRFTILDYSEFEPRRASWPVRLAFRLECPLATDFVRRDWRSILAREGFAEFRARAYYFGHVRLLDGVKGNRRR